MGIDAGETPRAQAHHVTDSLVEVDLVTELEALRATDSYQAADHAAKTIAKQPGIRVVRISPLSPPSSWPSRTGFGQKVAGLFALTGSSPGPKKRETLARLPGVLLQVGNESSWRFPPLR